MLSLIRNTRGTEVLHKNLYLANPTFDMCILTQLALESVFLDKLQSAKIITQTCPCIMQRFLKAVKTTFLDDKIDIFLIFAQNIDCRFTLEPPQ